MTPDHPHPLGIASASPSRASSEPAGSLTALWAWAVPAVGMSIAMVCLARVWSGAWAEAPAIWAVAGLGLWLLVAQLIFDRWYATARSLRLQHVAAIVAEIRALHQPLFGHQADNTEQRLAPQHRPERWATWILGLAESLPLAGLWLAVSRLARLEQATSLLATLGVGVWLQREARHWIAELAAFQPQGTARHNLAEHVASSTSDDLPLPNSMPADATRIDTDPPEPRQDTQPLEFDATADHDSLAVDEFEQPLAAPGEVSWQRRSLVDGCDTLTGELSIEFPAGVRDVTTAIPVYPPFAKPPEAEAEDVDAGVCSVTIEPVQPFGLKLVATRPRDEHGQLPAVQTRIAYQAAAAVDVDSQTA